MAQELEIYKTLAFEKYLLFCINGSLWEVVVHDGSICFIKGTIAEN